MKKNGFVLIETVIVIVFVTGLFTFLFSNMLPLFAEYNKVNNYDTIEATYGVHLIRKMILRDEECRVRSLLNTGTEAEFYFAKDEVCYFLKNKNYCKMLLSDRFLNVKNIVITNYVTTELKTKSPEYLTRNLREYIRYMPEYDNVYNVLDTEPYAYTKRLIVEFENGTVGSIELLKEENDVVTCVCG